LSEYQKAPVNVDSYAASEHTPGCTGMRLTIEVVAGPYSTHQKYFTTPLKYGAPLLVNIFGLAGPPLFFVTRLTGQLRY
jgi:hypothetical protein